MSRYSEPSELWCMVDSVTAAMASMIGSLPPAEHPKATTPKMTAAAAA